MKKLILYLITASFVITLFNYAFAKRMPPELGSVETFLSENGRYSVEIKILGYPDMSPSKCTFKERDTIIWSKEIPTTPGKVNISNNGKAVVLANWGWYDEGGFRGLSFYNSKGELLKDISFGDKDKGSMLWIRETAISPDGMHYIFGTDGREKAKLYLYEFESANLLWLKDYGFEKMVEIEISDKDGSILTATFNYNSGDMLFVLLNIDGDMLWQKKIEKNFSWDIKDYLHLSDNGENFEIFDRASRKYISFINKAGKIIQK